MTRNILLQSDIAALRAALAQEGVAAAPSANSQPGNRRLGGGLVVPPDLVPTPDSWSQRLLKYIPGEALGFYLGLDRAAHTFSPSGAEPKFISIALLLWFALLAGAIFNVFYLWKVANVSRVSQIVISTIALFGYIYATGGVFQEIGWANPTFQMLIVILIGGLLIFFKPIDSPAVHSKADSSARSQNA